MSIGRRVMLLVASALIVVTMAAVTASPAFAAPSDHQLRNRIYRIQDRPGPLTHHEHHLIHELRHEIRTN